jgi:hypothetical protein
VLLKLLVEEAVCRELLLPFFLRVGFAAEAGAAIETVESRTLEDAMGIWRESVLPTRIDIGCGGLGF